MEKADIDLLREGTSEVCPTWLLRSIWLVGVEDALEGQEANHNTIILS